MGICHEPSLYGAQNGSQSYNDTHYNKYSVQVIFYYFILPTLTILVCIFGILGNGMVIWLLGFHVKRSHFTTYILNLAIADFVLLMASVIYIACLSRAYRIHSVLYRSFYSFFNTSECFLTVISMDRCISIFFPIWYRCQRPKHLSTIVCALIWVLSFLAPATMTVISVTSIWLGGDIIIIAFMVISVISFPLMTISSLMFSIKVCCKAKQQQKKILITILIIVFVFLFLCFPVNVITMIFLFCRRDFNLIEHVMFCGCLNSSVNPLIYYLVGRRKKRRSKRSVKAALQELFKEEEI